MRGSHSQLTITTTTDEATGAEIPLFAFPVQICKASGSEDPRFDRATPHLSEYDTVYRDKVTQEIFENEDLVKGVRTGVGFVTIPEAQIEAVTEQTKLDDMRVIRALPLDAVDRSLVTGRYYLQAPPKGGSHKHYRLTFEGLQGSPKKGKKAAVPAMALEVKFATRDRQKRGVVFADTERGCLVLLQMSFAAEVREPDEAILAPSTVEVDTKQVAMVRKVIDGLVTPEDYEEPVDEAIPLKRELLTVAAAGEPVEVAEIPAPEVATSEDLESVLEASLAAA